MRITVDARTALTTDATAGPHGQPLLLHNGRRYGPHDTLPNGTPARHVVMQWAQQRNTPEAHALAQRFCGLPAMPRM